MQDMNLQTVVTVPHKPAIRCNFQALVLLT